MTHSRPPETFTLEAASEARIAALLRAAPARG